MKLHLHTFELRLKHPFTISRGTVTHQPTLIVELADEGLRGFGEATTNAYYGRGLRPMARHLEACRREIETTSWDDPRELWQALAPRLAHDPFAQCALDQAAFDLWGKRQGQPVYELLGWKADDPRPLSNYTLGIDSLPHMIAKMREFSDWPIYKVKLGTQDDLGLIRGLRAETSARFRVDANCGWDVGQTLALAPRLAELGVEFIEQPLPAAADEAMTALRRRLSLPLIADESCQTLADVDRCAQVGFDGINIKLVKCGGLTPALAMMALARQRGLQCMVGCMTESSVGISAIAQLLPGLDYVDMDGAVLLAEDIAQGVTLERGRCRYPDVPGSGIRQLRTDQALDLDRDWER